MPFREWSPEEIMEEIEEGLEYRRKFGLEDVWGSLEAIYYSVHESMVNCGPNVLLSQGDAMMSSLSVPSPRVSISAVDFQSVEKAPKVEALDNMFLDEVRIPEAVEDAILQAYLFGTGIIKCGYDSEWGYDPTHDLGGSLRLGLTLTQMDRTGSRNIEYNANVQPGMPWCTAVMPHDIVVPWGTKSLETTPWIAHRVVRHIDDLRADRKYSNVRDLEPQISMRDFVESYRSTVKAKLGKMNTGEPEYVEFYEVQDRRTGKIQAVTWDHDKFLRNEDNALMIDGRLPYASISFTPRTRAFWTTPDAYYLLYVQNELSDITIQRTKQRRLSVLKFLYDSGSITEAELAKVLSSDVGAAAKIESGRDITKAIIKLENTPSPFLAQEEETVRANGREQIGFSRNQLGEYTGGRKTATEVGTVEKSSQLRMSKRGLKVKRLYEDVLRTVNGIVFTHWTLGKVIEILGDDGVSNWETINGPSLRGRYAFKIELIDDSELQSRGMQALQLYSLLSQDSSVDPLELRTFLMNKVNDPAFGKLFNAAVRNAMPQPGVQGSGGGVRPNANGTGRPATTTLQQMQGENGETGVQAASRFLA